MELSAGGAAPCLVLNGAVSRWHSTLPSTAGSMKRAGGSNICITRSSTSCTWPAGQQGGRHQAVFAALAAINLEEQARHKHFKQQQLTTRRGTRMHSAAEELLCQLARQPTRQSTHIIFLHLNTITRALTVSSLVASSNSASM
jgi:hypothetical protein